MPRLMRLVALMVLWCPCPTTAAAQTTAAGSLQEAAARLKDAKAGPSADLRVKTLDLISDKPKHAAFKVTITWDTATDVDLWIAEPGGQKCWYQNVKTTNGGVITPDDTQGFGPETYFITKGPQGEYVIQINMYAIRNSGATTVTTEIVSHPGTPHQTVQRYTSVLSQNGQTITVARLKF